MVRVLETQTVAPNSIPLPLHVVLELNKHTLTLPCSVAVWLGFWKSEHDETWKLAKFHKTAAERGEAKLRLLNLKTTWSEF